MRKIYLEIKYGRGKSLRGYILDLSMVGMSAASYKRIGKDTIVEIITRNNILPRIKGKIVSAVYYRQRKAYKYRLGIKFISIEKEEGLRRFIRKIENRRATRLIFM